MHDDSFKYQDERFADLQLLRYKVEGFETLSLRQKTLVWHLSEAALWGRDILWDQNGKYNLEIRQLLEYLFVHYSGNRECEEFRAFETYLKRIWFSNGIHHHYATDKFKPDFTREYLIKLIRETQNCCTSEESAALPSDHRLTLLLDVIFNPDIMPKRVNQAQGEDLLLTSACNYYEEGITQQEAEDFYNQQKEAVADKDHPIMFGMNSRLTKDANGQLTELVWKEDGLYGEAIRHITEHLEAALDFAESEEQKEVIKTLVEFYRTGDLSTFDRYTIQWVQNIGDRIDFTNGFTEVYGDPLGLKASWEGYVNFTDLQATQRTETLSRNAQWFEDNSPVDHRFKKKECRGVSAKVIVAAMLGGDLYPSSAIGINLPNSNWVRAKHGSKSVTIGNLTHAYDEAAKGGGFRQEFVIDEETIRLINDYGHICDDLHTDLHECLGHGSGQLLPGVDPDALKAYGSTIEEARADLFGLYYLADPKLVELGLTPNEEAYKSQYYTYLMNGLMTQLVRIEPGNNIEEAHMRNRALISHWVLEHYPEAIELQQRPLPQPLLKGGELECSACPSPLEQRPLPQPLLKGGELECSACPSLSESPTNSESPTKLESPTNSHVESNQLPSLEEGLGEGSTTFLRIHSYPTLRTAFGRLLGEIQRIKSEGDFAAAQQLVEDYAVKVDATLHAEVLRRYKALNLAPYKGFINPYYEIERNAEGLITAITPHYDESFAEQMLRYSKEYRAL